MKLAKPQEKPLLVLLLKRASTLLFIWLLALLYLYIIGNMQGFLEKSMVSIMFFMKASAAFLLILAFCGALTDLFLLLYQRKLRWLWGLGTYLLLMTFSLSVSVLSSGIGLLVDGLARA